MKATGLFAVVYFVPFLLAFFVMESSPILGAMLFIADMIITYIITVGAMWIGIKLYNNEYPALTDMFSKGRKVIPIVIASLLYAFIVMLGTILYRSKGGQTVNADLNGAANILRKASQRADFSLVDWIICTNPARLYPLTTVKKRTIKSKAAAPAATA